MDKAKLIMEYQKTRSMTESLCQNLLIEDYIIQSMEDVSPPKWHLAHTTWFFETFILKTYADYKSSKPLYSYLFNSYYQGIGKPFPRCKRGLLARPSVEQVYEYRHEIDTQLMELFNNMSQEFLEKIQPLIILGINHEQQHQELLLMDIKHNFYADPSLPSYCKHTLKLEKGVLGPVDICSIAPATPTFCGLSAESMDPADKPRDVGLETKCQQTLDSKVQFIDFEGGLVSIGYQGDAFCFDNELPMHQNYINPFSISNNLVSNKEYLEFISDNAYSRPELWLSDAWDWLQINQITAPLYWQLQENQWMIFTLYGLNPVNPVEPVSHISFYEAEAFSRWKACRLPTEEEWEHAALQLQNNGEENFLETQILHPQSIQGNPSIPQQFFGDLWEWTASAYLPYPGYKPLKGALGEYNGKFMNNQRVLRGGSFATPRHHFRPSYRNFYGPDKRWQFSGIRLAKDI